MLLQPREGEEARLQQPGNADGRWDFTPLVFTASGTASRECTQFLKALTVKLNTKTNENTDNAMSWLRCKIYFLCIKHLGLCIRGTRSLRTQLYVSSDFETDLVDANI